MVDRWEEMTEEERFEALRQALKHLADTTGATIENLVDRVKALETEVAKLKER
jgi:hypothetical protein